MKLRHYLISALVLVVQACGYTFQGSGSVLPADVRRIYIPIAENSSTDAGLSTLITEAMRDHFERFGVVTVVDDAKDADAILHMRILKLNRDASSIASRTDTTLKLELTLNLAAELRRVSGPVLWRNTNLLVSRQFGTASNVIVTSSSNFATGTLGAGDLGNISSRELSRGQEQDALEDLADEAARKVYDDAVAPDF